MPRLGAGLGTGTQAVAGKGVAAAAGIACVATIEGGGIPEVSVGGQAGLGADMWSCVITAASLRARACIQPVGGTPAAMACSTAARLRARACIQPVGGAPAAMACSTAIKPEIAVGIKKAEVGACVMPVGQPPKFIGWSHVVFHGADTLCCGCTSGGAAGSTAVVGRSWVVPLVVGWTSTIPSRAASDPEVRVVM